jgi:hypothetical protein
MGMNLLSYSIMMFHYPATFGVLWQRAVKNYGDVLVVASMALLPSVCWLLFIVVDIIRVPHQKDWNDGGSSNNNGSVSVLKPPK